MCKSDAEFIGLIDKLVYNVSPDILRDEEGVHVRINGKWIPVEDWKDSDGPSLLRLAKHFYQLGRTDERWRLTRGIVEDRPGGFITVSIGMTPFGLGHFMHRKEGRLLTEEIENALKRAYARYLEGNLVAICPRKVEAVMEEIK